MTGQVAVAGARAASPGRRPSECEPERDAPGGGDRQGRVVVGSAGRRGVAPRRPVGDEDRRRAGRGALGARAWCSGIEPRRQRHGRSVVLDADAATATRRGRPSATTAARAAPTVRASRSSMPARRASAGMSAARMSSERARRRVSSWAIRSAARRDRTRRSTNGRGGAMAGAGEGGRGGSGSVMAGSIVAEARSLADIPRPGMARTPKVPPPDGSLGGSVRRRGPGGPACAGRRR